MKEKNRKTLIVCLSHAPQPETQSTTQAHALTGDRTDWQPFGAWDDAPSAGATQPGRGKYFLIEKGPGSEVQPPPPSGPATLPTWLPAPSLSGGRRYMVCCPQRFLCCERA